MTISANRRTILGGISSAVFLMLLAGCGGGSGEERDAAAGSDVVAGDDAARDGVADPDVLKDADGAVPLDIVEDHFADTLPDGDAPTADDAAADVAADAETGTDVESCVDGCFIDGTCFVNLQVNPANPCEFCVGDTDAWTSGDQGACSDGVFCNGAETCTGRVCGGGAPPCNGVEKGCLEAEWRCCSNGVATDVKICNADGDVVAADDCGNPMFLVQLDCHVDRVHGACYAGMCGCADGWTGARCDRCVRYALIRNGDDSASGDAWDHAYFSVQAAVDAAAADGCEVWVAGGTYLPTADADRNASFRMRDGVDLYGGFAGDETTRFGRAVADNRTILSGDIGEPGLPFDNSYHVVRGANARIDGFEITGGYADGEIPGTEDRDRDAYGGGMLNIDVAPVVSRCVFVGNLATAGGGMYNRGAPTIVNCMVAYNNAVSGAGMYNAGTSHVWNTVVISNFGDGVMVTETADIVNCTIAFNDGDGIGLSNAPGPTVRNSILWGNGSVGIRNGLVGADATYNLVQGGYPGTGNLQADPLFVDAQGLFLRLSEGSPAIDAGRSDLLPGDVADLDDDGDTAESLPLDQEDATRRGGRAVDMGALESPYESSVQDPVSCLAIHGTAEDRGDGLYWIDWDGPGGEAPVQVHCDMTNDGGGWTRVVNIRGDSKAHINNMGAAGDVSDATAAAKLSDAAISRLNTVGYWRFNCSTGVNGFVRNGADTWTSMWDNGLSWQFDRGRDGTFECDATRSYYVFSDYTGCPDEFHFNYGNGGQLGCSWAYSWGQDGNVWAR
jgi:hypothetical protein